MPTPIYHFTHVDNLASILVSGRLMCDHGTRDDGCLAVDVGSRDIKGRRREQEVPCGPGGVVADYVPFYYAPRSPMLYSIHRGNVPQYSDGQGPLVYLVSSVGRVIEAGRPIIFADGNAASGLTTMFDDPDELVGRIDWDVMALRFWNNTPDDGDRMRRRMAEALVHEYVPATCIERIGCRTEAIRGRVAGILETGAVEVDVDVVPAWYY